MTGNEPDQPRRRTMSPVLREWLKNPIFQKIESPQGGGIIITGVGPQSRPPETKPAGTEPDKAEPEADDEHR